MRNISLLILIFITLSTNLISQMSLLDNFYFSSYQRIKANNGNNSGAINRNYSFGFDFGTNNIKSLNKIEYGFGLGFNYLNQAQNVLGYVQTNTFTFNRISESDRTHIISNLNLQINFIFKSILFSEKGKLKLFISPEIQYAILDNSKLASLTTYFEENERIEKTWTKDKTKLSLGGSIGLSYPFKSSNLDLMVTYLSRKSYLLTKNIDSTYLRLRINWKI